MSRADDVQIWVGELNDAVKLYQQSHDIFGDKLEALRWGSKASQTKRFEALAQIGNVKSASIMDVGSGLADFLDYLETNEFNGNFHGIDPVASFVSTASQRFPDHKFSQGSIFDIERFSRADFLFASGLFTFVKHKPLAFLRFVVEQMLARANKGIAINALSAWGSEPSENECQFEPGEVLTVLRGVAPRITLRHDYLPHDLTVYAWAE